MCEEMLRVYLDHLTVLRVRMPISDDLLARNFVTKITRYEKVVNIPNSMTVLTELLPASLALSERRISGIYNFTNPVRAREPRAAWRAAARAHALTRSPPATSPGRDLAQRSPRALQEARRPVVHVEELHRAGAGSHPQGGRGRLAADGLADLTMDQGSA